MTWQSETRAWLVSAAAVVCLGSIGYRVISAPKIPDLAPTVAKVNSEIDEAHRLTLEAGLTAMEARKASAKEISQLDIWNNQFSQSVSVFQQVMIQTRNTLAAVQGTSEAATQTVVDLRAPIAQATATLKSAQDAIQAGQRATEALQLAVVHLDVLVTDPAIPKTVKNVQTMTENGDAATSDLKDYIHGILHPTWPKRLWGYTIDVAHAVL